MPSGNSGDALMVATSSRTLCSRSGKGRKSTADASAPRSSASFLRRSSLVKVSMPQSVWGVPATRLDWSDGAHGVRARYGPHRPFRLHGPASRAGHHERATTGRAMLRAMTEHGQAVATTPSDRKVGVRIDVQALTRTVRAK